MTLDDQISLQAKELVDLMELTKKCVKDVAFEFSRNENKINTKKHKFDKKLKKEVKSLADNLLEEKILKVLESTGFSILSEESGKTIGKNTSDYLFIIDPLDGTFNYIRGSGPSAISIAFWKNNEPVFGVIYNLNTEEIFWGGKEFGSYCNGDKISVSEIGDPSEAALFTGFPVRFSFREAGANLFNSFSDFAKIRMIGSACISLVNIANGSGDLYFEKNIMLWDVAAGIAIVEGAGGKVNFQKQKEKYCLNVIASNNKLSEYNFNYE